ncbi:helix-turn-helix domain-containing protein, partial [Bifidobacterium pullorum subsp. saeculare]|nr:helix-turn-helix domain-containing protein [Bifidobacterium pullorum subsp. saeculare]
MRERAADLFAQGRGYVSVARVLGVPAKAVRRWRRRYRAVGRESLLGMGETPGKYGFEARLAAARAVVGDGMAKPEAMRGFGVANMASLDNWCRLCRGEG